MLIGNFISDIENENPTIDDFTCIVEKTRKTKSVLTLADEFHEAKMKFLETEHQQKMAILQTELNAKKVEHDMRMKIMEQELVTKKLDHELRLKEFQIVSRAITDTDAC